MKTSILIILILLFSSTAWSQSFKPAVKSYYENVYLAETAILDSNYSKALYYYNEAFTFNTPFKRDIYNAIRVCRFLNDTKQMAEYEKVNEGLNRKSDATVTYSLISKGINKKVDFMYSKQAVQATKRDQDIRDSCSKITFELYSNLDCADAIKKVDFANVKVLSTLVDEISKSKKNGINESIANALWLIALHNTAWKNYKLIWDIISLAEKGLFDVRELGELIDRISGNNKDFVTLPSPLCNKYYMIDIFIVKKSLFIEQLDSAKNHKVDSVRATLCLCPYDLQVRKTVYQFTDTNFRFVNNQILMLSKEEHDYMIKKCSNNPKYKYTIITKP